MGKVRKILVENGKSEDCDAAVQDKIAMVSNSCLRH